MFLEVLNRPYVYWGRFDKFVRETSKKTTRASIGKGNYGTGINRVVALIKKKLNEDLAKEH